jgi:hypothetical protein
MVHSSGQPRSPKAKTPRSSAIGTCKSGRGRRWSRHRTRPSDSRADSARASAKSTTSIADRIPGQRRQSARTARSPARSAAPRRSAESATTIASVNGSSRARSTTVRAADVTGTPRTRTTWCGGRAALRNSTPTRSRLMPRPTVSEAVVGCGASVDNSCSQAADSWLPAVCRARAPSSAARVSACANRGSSAAAWTNSQGA